ncbi:hypothetical protein ACFXKD_00565 [Nocardiopsis aegyptia]|uniref:hypothetical protein n=1 Tax=Nocardiopsis aegyptia TaxID=220378 RepID=UPI00366E23FE
MIIWVVIMFVLVVLTQYGVAPVQVMTLVAWSLALTGTATMLLTERGPASAAV